MADNDPALPLPHASPRRPGTPGIPATMDALTSVAAPLLAGAAIATIGVLCTDSAAFRWPALSMLLFTWAAISLVACVQISIRARRFLYTRDEFLTWTPSGAELDREITEAESAIRNEHFERWLGLSMVATWAYQAGVCLLALGTSALLIPKAGTSTGDAVLRWIAIGSILSMLALHAVLVIRRFFKEVDDLAGLMGSIYVAPNTP